MSINVFIGTSPNGEDREIELVYEYTLRKNCSEDINITWMKLSENKKDIWGGWKTSKWFTPFSGLRWAIPHACNFSGKALYTDVDMINFKDICDLYYSDMNGKPFAARKGRRWGHELCVMLIDCEKAGDYIWDLRKLKKDKSSHAHHRHFVSESELVHEIDPRWNCLDGENLPLEKIYQLHFTNMSTQPWHPSWYKGKALLHERMDILNKFFELKDEALNSGMSLASIPEKKISYDILL